MDATHGAKRETGETKMANFNNTFNGHQLKADLSVDTHVSQTSGETIYTVCDSIGVVYTTIFPSRLERFFANPL